MTPLMVAEIRWFKSPTMTKKNKGLILIKSVYYTIPMSQLYKEANKRLTAWSGELKGTEADIVEGFIVQNHAFICIFNQLVNGKGCIVRLHNSVRHLWGWEHGKCKHHAIGILFPDLGNQKCSHPRTCSTTQ